MKVSFVIPVYKTENYIQECVNSILNQSYKDFEIILVDDGSPDNCPEICDNISKIDKRVRTFHKENGGLSDARNYGLHYAEGEYIIFVDSDDFWCNNHSLEQIVNEINLKSECDFICFNCYYYYEGKNIKTPWKPYCKELNGVVDRNIAMRLLVESGTFPMSAWLKILKRDFLLRNGLFFIKGQIAEDIPWFINVLDKCKKCSFVNLYVYAYRQNVIGSITNKGGSRSFHSLLDIVETEIGHVEKRNFNSIAKEALYSFLAYELCILLSCKNDAEADKQRILAMRWLLNYDVNPKVRIVNKVNRLLGWNMTAKILRLYNHVKRRSLIVGRLFML